MYDGKSQLLIENPINRYLINSPMLPAMKKNPDGSLTLYIQKDSPGKAKEANWLPAPNGTVYLVMRLYWPKDTPPSILPPGEGTLEASGGRGDAIVAQAFALPRTGGDRSASHPELPALHALGGTYPDGISAPPPKKCFSICSASHLRARASARLRRFSLTSIVWCLSHACHASFDTLS